jgi:TRAP-type mannitol/chloroaromatic compound transport system substrate-binding protein
VSRAWRNSSVGRRARSSRIYAAAARRLNSSSAQEKSVSKSNHAARSRRNFLAGAGAAALGFPMIAKGQTGPVTMRFQSAWTAKDILHEYALDFAKTVNDMTGGDLRIEVLPVNAFVPPAGLLDAVSKGALDGGHGALMDHYDRSNAFALWGSGPAFGMDSNLLLAWHKWGGGRELLEKLYAAIGGKVVSFLYAPQATPPLGWFKKPVTKWEDFKDLKYGTAGLSIDVFTAMGAEVKSLPGGGLAAAIADGQVDAADAGNASSDRALGFAAASKVYMLQSYHRSAEQLEIIFNKARYDALSGRLRAVISVAVDAASQNATWKAIDRNSRDFVALQEQDKVHVYKTPNSVLLKELECYDEMLAKKSGGNPLFKEILESQKKFAERAVKWEQEVVVSRHLAYDHYFNHPVAAPKKS